MQCGPLKQRRQVHARIKEHALGVGLAVYPTGGTIDGSKGDHLMMAPPYISQPHHIETIVERLAQAIEAALR
jgi:adenosylmethionine-8-amino-7-oxononanoate aminotransferase